MLNRFVRWSVLIVFCSCPLGMTQAKPVLRPFAVSDSIGMTWPVPAGDGDETMVVSADGRTWAIVTRQGNIADNSNIYALRLVAQTIAGATPTVKTLSRFASTSNRPGISRLRWLGPTTLTFIGEREDELPQVWAVDVNNGRLRQLTREHDVIENYALAALNGPLLLDMREKIDGRDANAQGYLVGDRLLHSVWLPDGSRNPYPTRQLRIVHGRISKPIDLSAIERVRAGPWLVLAMSPNSRFAVVLMQRQNYPREWWTRYAIARNSGLADIYGPKGDGGGVGELPDVMCQYHLIDLKNGKVLPIADAPVLGSLSQKEHPQVRWSADSSLLTVSGQLSSIDGPARNLSVQVGRERTAGPSLAKPEWDSLESWLGPVRGTPQIVVDQNLNRPPELAYRQADGRYLRFTRWNGALDGVALDEVRKIQWHDSKGRTWTGKLILPPVSLSVKRVPLVLYTHGYSDDDFWVDGPANATMGYAGRAMAAAGIAVLDVRDRIYDRNSPAEIASAVDGYASAVDHLDHLGLIDRKRVGIHAWSRTGYYLLDTLLDDRVHYLAASAADADILSRQHLTDFFMIPWRGMRDVEQLMGAPFWGDGVRQWEAREPLKRLSEIKTPLRIETTAWLPAWWDAYALLRRHGRYAEYISYPDGDHSLVKPRERLTSQQGTVDWYSRWLLGPVKANKMVNLQPDGNVIQR